MFCKNCGKEIAEGTRFCDNCGTAVETQTQYTAPVQPEYTTAQAQPEYVAPVQTDYVAPAQPEYTAAQMQPEYAAPMQNATQVAVKKKKTGIIIIIAAVLALVAIIIGVVIGISGKKDNTPEKVAEKAVVALSTADPETLLDCVPEFYLKKIAQQQGLLTVDKKAIAAAMRSNISIDDIKTCVIIGSMRSFDRSEIKDYTENLMEYGATYEDLSKIKDACTVNVTALVDGESEEYTVACIKLKNKWYVLDFD